MSREELALETQLLLQEVTQAKQFEVSVEADGPPLSEFEVAKQALVDKLRKKKEQNRQQQQQLNMKRYGFAGTAPGNSAASLQVQTQIQTPAGKGVSRSMIGGRLTLVKHKHTSKLPVAANAPVGSRKKKDLLSKLRQQAIQQGAQEMAKLFGYSSYEDQIKHLNKIEKMKILQSERVDKENDAPTPGRVDDKIEQSESEVDEQPTADATDPDTVEDVEIPSVEAAYMPVSAQPASPIAAATSGPAIPTQEAMSEHATGSMALPENAHLEDETQDLEALEAASITVAPLASTQSTTRSPRKTALTISTSTTSRRHRNHIENDDEDDGNDADSEQDEKGDEETEDAHMSDAGENVEPKDANKDRAAAFRQLLQAEAKQNRQRKRLRKGANFVESEAEEDEEEDVLKIGGLGDFGFGVPQAASKESKDAEDERNALKLREDDLEGIVDDLSDDERAQEQDLDEIYRRELEDQDRQQVKEVMRNVKEGFGRNRRAFSGLDAGSGARGRFNLDELVAADGDKVEAARLGLLESDEDLNDDEDYEDKKDSKGEEEEEEEVDEEAEMERMLRDRFMNQPKIYITSSESESEGENDAEKEKDDAAAEEIESDEERERQQMKLFSERARINRRMNRMKEMQRQVAMETEEVDQKAPVPNLLLEDDEDSQELLKVLNRTDVSRSDDKSVAKEALARTSSSAPRSQNNNSRPNRPTLGRFNSFGMGSKSRTASSFSRVADNCKLFSASSASSTNAKGFVFTSFSADKPEQGDENVAPLAGDAVATAPSNPASLAKSKSWGGSSAARKRPFAAVNGQSGNAAQGNKKRKSDFFSVLTSYQCVPQGTSAPM